MMNLLATYREWDGSLMAILDYFWDIIMYMWNQFGIIGLGVSIFFLLMVGMKSEDFGYFFSLIAASFVRAIGGTVGFAGTILQKIALYIGGQASQAVVREYVDRFKGVTKNASDSLKNKRK